MQIDRETIRLSCEPFRWGPVFKSQPDCLSGNLHSINRRDFLFKLELFFFSRGHLKLITSPRLLYKRGLCGCDYRVWSVRRRLSWHGEGGRPRPRELGQLFVPALRPVHNRAPLTAAGSVWMLERSTWEARAAGLEHGHPEGLHLLPHPLQRRHNLLPGFFLASLGTGLCPPGTCGERGLEEPSPGVFAPFSSLQWSPSGGF